MNIKKALIAMGLMLALAAPGGATAAPKIGDLLGKLDNALELKTDGTAEVEMTRQKDKEGVKIYKSIFYRRDRDDAFLILMTAPEVEKGNGYLRTGDNFWMYRRNTRTFQHINRDESIAGSDAKSGDFEKKKWSELYQAAVDKAGAEKVVATKLGAIDVYQFEVAAKTEDVTYPKRVLWIRQDNYLPLKTQDYSANGTLMNTAYFISYQPYQGKFLWVKAIFVDEFEKGDKTIVEIKNISFKKIDDYVFTKAYLESLSK